MSFSQYVLFLLICNCQFLLRYLSLYQFSYLIERISYYSLSSNDPIQISPIRGLNVTKVITLMMLIQILCLAHNQSWWLFWLRRRGSNDELSNSAPDRPSNLLIASPHPFLQSLKDNNLKLDLETVNFYFYIVSKEISLKNKKNKEMG